MQASHAQLEKDKAELLKKQEALVASLSRRETELSAMQASHAQLEKDKHAAEDVNNLLQEMQKKLITQQKKLSNNAVLQIESYMRLQNYVADDIVLPDMHGWPISPDLGMQLVQLIETGNYDAVVEFGSGVSTLLMALALKKQAKKSIAMPAKLIAFEHLAAYFEQTKKLLSASGLNANVTLIHAKLISIKGLNQTNFDYYDCLEALKQFKKELKIPNPKIMVFVDGPPGATGPHARYPAMQSIEQVFEGSAYVDYLMDDYMRKEECEIVSMWEQHFNDQGREVEKKEYLALEKQACVLSVKAFQKASKFINKTEIDSKYEK
jgi:predicted O-methyltransferase YrrM